MAKQVPSFQDEVKHILAGIMGTVIATYTVNDIPCLDVRSAEIDRIYYASRAANWEVIRTREEIEGTTDA